MSKKNRMRCVAGSLLLGLVVMVLLAVAGNPAYAAKSSTTTCSVVVGINVQHTGVQIEPRLLNGSTYKGTVVIQLEDSHGKKLGSTQTIRLSPGTPYKNSRKGSYYVNSGNASATFSVVLPSDKKINVRVIRYSVSIKGWLTGNGKTFSNNRCNRLYKGQAKKRLWRGYQAEIPIRLQI